ncbi:hypothetical protein [Vibrio phage YC]|uniref:Macro domain-containing protein n=1 Tax=Vibrio phage YC TaxID=2267403 RepID=A0A384ZS54_9CAUD|nr:hypothetical protein HWB64_gp117 [Vibrio phage YC]AXC34486.1 hypothetical protein [Vibrio phage YC]
MIVHKLMDVRQAILEEISHVAAHGCNCHCTMRSGVAPLLCNLVPGLREADNATAHGDHRKLGHVSSAWFRETPVYNAYTQYGTATMPNQLVVDYSAVQKAFMVIVNNAMARRQRNTDRPFDIAIPMIGAGLAGGDWTTIRRLIMCAIERRAPHENVKVLACILPDLDNMSKALGVNTNMVMSTVFILRMANGRYGLGRFDHDKPVRIGDIETFSPIDPRLLAHGYSMVTGDGEPSHFSNTIWEAV